jgi:cell division septum initiation protein DivIVA
MEELKKNNFVVYEVDESQSLIECLGLSDKRSDELTDIVKDAHMKSDRLSEAADLMSRYAENATELWYMAFVYGCATAESRSNPLEKLLHGLTQIKRKLDDDDSE